MVQLSSDRYNLAWFKLAEFVVRKEKERALGMYRLLIHSLPDEAFSAQLEGDLLLAFNDDKAHDAYLRAARFYEDENRLAHAVAIYEHLCTIAPHNHLYILAMMRLYEAMNNSEKVVRCLSMRLRLFLKDGQNDQALTIIGESRLDAKQRTQLYEYYVISLLETQSYSKTQLAVHIETIIDTLNTEPDSSQVTLFLAKLAAIDSHVHAYACALVSNMM
jgi:tetratricopeptide (TPR) repeat protein